MLTRVELSKIAAEFAKEIISQYYNTIVHPRDAPYIEAVLTEAILFELPIKNLSVSIASPEGAASYDIFLSGYMNEFDMVKWINIFLGRNRNDMFFNVTNVHFQNPVTRLGPNILLQVTKIPALSKSEINCRRAILVWSLCGMRLGISRDLRKLIGEKIWKTRFELVWLDKKIKC